MRIFYSIFNTILTEIYPGGPFERPEIREYSFLNHTLNRLDIFTNSKKSEVTLLSLPLDNISHLPDGSKNDNKGPNKNKTYSWCFPFRWKISNINTRKTESTFGPVCAFTVE